MSDTSSNHRNVIIIGSGPSGYTAGLYTARADLRPLLFEGSQYGGALMNTTEVENFPGFTDGIMGPDLMMNIRGQAERFGAEIVSDDVTAVDLTGTVKIVRTLDAEYTADAVILATGSAYRKLGIEREDELSGRGVSWCATCDGFFFRDQDIVVVGGGDTAMEEATFLSRFAKSVTVVHRRDTLRASRVMCDRAEADPKIHWIWNSAVVGIESDADNKVSGLRLQDTVTGEERDFEATGLFIAIGHEPRSELVADQVELDAEGYVVVQPGSTRTSLAGVFAAGDLVDHTYRQAITAAGTGCEAALDAQNYLADLEHSLVAGEPAGFTDASRTVAASV
ncbi:thioredoxin reductase (NADPH) [Jatrophihabitans sp. GAS493]|uniref:thioredoxin-disulfide reductase n=1 Tax=Jatrophihabitans sp. GAS493 TaxID=1907575 RepID=UPI000BB69729|nr:thioredoxin-disulfide reductase [Jatrophihabitans sp. GAS493]SOD71253.1 thioredoxin reductase (NADPH) [Jatrophihabitans sp. GAS493]